MPRPEPADRALGPFDPALAVVIGKVLDERIPHETSERHPVGFRRSLRLGHQFLGKRDLCADHIAMVTDTDH